MNKPRDLFLVERPCDTLGWIYEDRQSAEKRLSSGLKRPDHADEYRIVHVREVPPNQVVLDRNVVDKIMAYLNEDIAMLPCESRLRTMDEDTWGHGMYLRDILEAALATSEGKDD